MESLGQSPPEHLPQPPPAPARSVLVPLAERSRYARRYPPLGRKDTIIIRPGQSARSIYESSFAPFIQDSEILHIHPLQPAHLRGLSYGLSEGLAVIQQQGVRGCTAASAEMLIHDRLGSGAVSVDHLQNTNLGDSSSISARISRTGLRPLVTTLHSGDRRNFLEQLAAAVVQHGPASLGIEGEIGGHNIVLDQVDLQNNRATLRDPWHGWRITISVDSLYQRLGSGEQTLVQIARSRE